jgi:hypothetical protein
VRRASSLSQTARIRPRVHIHSTGTRASPILGIHTRDPAAAASRTTGRTRVSHSPAAPRPRLPRGCGAGAGANDLVCQMTDLAWRFAFSHAHDRVSDRRAACGVGVDHIGTKPGILCGAGAAQALRRRQAGRVSDGGTPLGGACPSLLSRIMGHTVATAELMVTLDCIEPAAVWRAQAGSASTLLDESNVSC